ncbi:MAG: hypothetical protein DRI57_20600 [Deltaproteobacteria bacterium]|nr:MAG: hypothetical protein DRI57_20600 [Deltaproteobacteria bacterium]
MIRDHFRLTIRQTDSVLNYIRTHYDEVDNLSVARKSGKYAQNLYYQHLAAVIIRKNLRTEGLSRSLFVKACETGSYVIRSLSGFLRRHPVM